MKNCIEITAPVGSFESLQAAIQAGADSVYFGMGKLNMRSASSVNFTPENIRDIVSICHNAGIYAYLTLNSVVFDDEFDELNFAIEHAARVGVDAIIAADMAVIERCRQKTIPIHISTQANITNIDAVRFYSRFADVMVLSREMTLERASRMIQQIMSENICGPSGNLVRIEAFAHGALCMAISGKCYLSLDNANSSANRGACTQICRRPYKVTDMDGGVELLIDNQYIMSPKDLATLPFLDKIVDAGISILKIEGRGRPPEYVKLVTSVYKAALASIQSGTFSLSLVDDWMKKLSEVYNRGFWGGYYLGKQTGEWTSNAGSSASSRKEFIGLITNYFSKLGVAEVKAQTGMVSLGEEILITGATTGVYDGFIDSMHDNKGPVTHAEQGQLFSFPVNSVVRRGDKVYRIIRNQSL